MENQKAFQHFLTELERLNKKYNLQPDEMLEVKHLDFTMFNKYTDAFITITIDVTNEIREVTKSIEVLSLDAYTYQYYEREAKKAMLILI